MQNYGALATTATAENANTHAQNIGRDILSTLEGNLLPIDQGIAIEFVLRGMIERAANLIQSTEQELKTRHAEMDYYLNINKVLDDKPLGRKP